jgi:voltage-gated potassium channel Kch
MEVVVVDDDPGVAQSVARQGVTVLRGDAADPVVLREAGAERAKAIVSTMRRAQDNARLLSTVRGPVVLVRVFSEQEADDIRALGGHPVVEAELAAETLVNWHAEVLAADRAGVPRSSRSISSS